jgi:large-conductance mechanosensitive channel
MLSFLLEEGVLTIGAISGIFTNNLLISLKANIIDPLTENVVPNHKLDRNGDGVVDEKDEKILQEELKKNKQIKWQSFLRDLIVWLILMILLYLLWTKIIKKIIKVPNNNVPNVPGNVGPNIPTNK